MPISPPHPAFAHYAPPPPLPAPSAAPAAGHDRVAAVVPTAPPGERQEMSDWAKLVIIWALLQSMQHGSRDDAPLAPPPDAGLTYNAKGQMQFGPTPAGQALTGSAPAASAAGFAHLGPGSGVAPTSGVGGGMVGAFINVTA